jgi:hypothetical protein
LNTRHLEGFTRKSLFKTKWSSKDRSGKATVATKIAADDWEEWFVSRK